MDLRRLSSRRTLSFEPTRPHLDASPIPLSEAPPAVGCGWPSVEMASAVQETEEPAHAVCMTPTGLWCEPWSFPVHLGSQLEHRSIWRHSSAYLAMAPRVGCRLRSLGPLFLHGRGRRSRDQIQVRSRK